MNYTKVWIEDAIKGGWHDSDTSYELRVRGNGQIQIWFFGEPEMDIEVALLNPLAWKAVGETRGWADYSPKAIQYGESETISVADLNWKYRQHQFIDHLASGLSIEQALEAISK